MALEIEAKMQLDDVEALNRRLTGWHAQCQAMLHEVDCFYDTPDRRLIASGQGLRIRTTISDDHPTERVMITHKGRRLAGQVKTRQETQLVAENAQDAAALLGTLGYQCILTFEKRRCPWRLGRCLVLIDTLPGLGSFVEIEGPDEKTVLDVRRQLQLHNQPIIQQGYPQLVEQWLIEHNSDNRRLYFDSYTASHN